MTIEVLFINPPYHRRAGSGITFPLGLGYVAAAVRKAGFSVALIDCASHFDTLTSSSLIQLKSWLSVKLREIQPVLAIGIGPCTTSAVRGLKVIAQICRDILPTTPTIYGGPAASLRGQEWFFFEELGGTAIVVGDGEHPFVQYLFALSENANNRIIPGVFYKPGPGTAAYVERNLDSLPFPARDLGSESLYRLSVRRDLGVKPFATLVGSRGCPHRCKFCVSGSLHGGTYSRRSFENIKAELEHLIINFSSRCLVFYDDALFPARQTVNEDLFSLSDIMIKFNKKLVWQFEIRPDIACYLEKEALRNAYASGCRQINLGIEKSSDLTLERIGKEILAKQSREACQRIYEGVPLMRIAGTFILGGPTETPQSVAETISFARSLPLTFAHFNPLELYPNTELYREVFGSDIRRWYYEIMKDDSPWGEIIFESDVLPKDRLLSLVNEAYASFYDDPNWLRRAGKTLGNRMKFMRPWAKTWRENRLGLPK